MPTMIKTVFCFVALLVAPFGHAMLPDFTGIVEDQSPAVVKITTVTHAKLRSNNPYDQYGVPQEQLPEIFRHFLKIVVNLSKESLSRWVRALSFLKTAMLSLTTTL